MIGTITNHIWQSTLFAAGVGLLTIAFRKNSAGLRYWLWLSASAKFLMPLAFLMSFGSHLSWAPTARRMSPPVISHTVMQVTQPFPDAVVPLPPSVRDAHDWIAVALLGAWACGFVALSLLRFRGWLRIRAAVRSSAQLQIPAPIEVRTSAGLLEPGVVGLFRPILLLPAGIVDRLSPHQLDAILAHEFCHVRRRDNLTAAIHMIVEAIFWFHPLVWWVGARLVEERERACDEDVLKLSGEPQVYADAILSVCKYYVESPLACVSGISGSEMKKRITAIMEHRVAQNLTIVRKLVLGLSAIAALAVPITIGLVQTPASRAQTTALPRFADASVKPSNSEDRRPLFQPRPDGQLTITNFTLRMLIRTAYGIQPYQISGGPSWMGSDLFDISAKTDAPPRDIREFAAMLQPLLGEKFQLLIRRETKHVPIFALVAAHNGPRLNETHESDPDMDEPLVRHALNRNNSGLPAGRLGLIILRRGLLIMQQTDIHTLAMQLSAILGRAVVDKTGLSGTYDCKLEWQPDANQVAMFQAMRVPEGFGAPAPDPSGPTLVAALEEQLGLKLEPENGPVEMFLVERAERPSADGSATQ